MKFDFYIPLKERIGLILFFLLIVSIHSYSIIHTKINGLNRLEKLEILHEIAREENVNSPIEVKIKNEGKQIDQVNLGQSEMTIPSPSQNDMPRKKEEPTETKLETDTDLLKNKDVVSQKSTTTSYDMKKPLSKEFVRSDSLFDPNKATYEELRAHGFGHFAASNLNKYVSGGGKIYKDSDLLRIYGVDTILFGRIVSQIAIEIDEKSKNKTFKKKKNFTYSKSETVVIDLNQADTSALKQLRGIGSSYAKRIVKYRDKLGGFISIDQVLEVYQFPPETFERIKAQLTVSGPVKKIFVPSLSFKEILRHPYIDFETTKTLKNISIQNFESSIKALIEKGSIDKRVLPYLHLSDPRSKTTTVTSLD